MTEDRFEFTLYIRQQPVEMEMQIETAFEPELQIQQAFEPETYIELAKAWEFEL